MSVTFVVVGIGAGGWDDLAPSSRRELAGADVVYGSRRQLALLPADPVTADRIAWRSPMSEHLADLLADPDRHAGDAVHVLASGDPMFHGIGASLVAAVGAPRVQVMPAPSSVSLAAARLGWDLADAIPVSLVTAAVRTLVPRLSDGNRLLILSRDADTPSAVACLLRAEGFGASTMTVLADLGGPTETSTRGTADEWPDAPSPALTVIGVHCAGPSRTRLPSLTDAAFDHDGQITKQPVRAMTVAALEPAEGQTLWDVGAGSGSIGVEWLRGLRTGRVVAFEADASRAAAAQANAVRHGVDDRYLMRAGAPAAFAGAPAPDTVFVGGGLTEDLLDRAWAALAVGGRLVANAVTRESERILADAATRRGGELVRLSVERVAPLGRSTAWRPALPIVQWSAVKAAAVSAREGES